MSEEAVGAGLAGRLTYLVALTRGHSGRPMSLNELVAAVHGATGVRIGRSTLNKLLEGNITNPHLHTIAALARFFGVPIEFFTQDEVADRVVAEVDLLRALQSRGVHSLAVRAEGLSDASLRLLANLVDQARVAEGLDQPGTQIFHPRQDAPGDT